MKVGYIRTSTKEQNLDRQIKLMEIHNVDKYFSEQLSGKNTTRPELQKLLKFVREGDELVIPSLDRLGRNYKDIKHIITMLQNKNVKLLILDAPFLNFNTGNTTLDNAMYDMFLSLLGYIAQFEREKILERQLLGIALAKERGIYKGRPCEYHKDATNPKHKLIYNNVVKMLSEQNSVTVIAQENGISRQTVYNIKKQLKKEC